MKHKQLTDILIPFIIKKSIIIILCLLSGFLSGISLAGEQIRILLIKPAEEIYLQDEFSIYADQKLIKKVSDQSITVESLRSYNTVLLKNSNGLFKIGHYKYRGDLKIIFKDKLYLINYLDIEEYIKGVLPNEISPQWPIEVIKAQAVAARSFAQHCVEKNRANDYDLTDTTFSQVYKGIINEDEVFNKAIKETEGEVLVYGNEIIQAFFHSACGGHTENAEKVWGKSLGYLRGTPCNYCRTSPHYEWEAEFSEQELLNILNQKGYSLQGIKAIIPEKMSSSGRWIKAKIIGTRKSVIIKGNDFRMMLGIKKLKSTKFRILRSGRSFVIKGKGWGHGVGLCQWGAKELAERGSKYYQILQYYYRGATLKRTFAQKTTSSRPRRTGFGY